MSGGTFYNPTAFRVDDPDVLGDCVDALTFATLLSNGPDGPRASHLPMLLDRSGGGTLRGHLARANDHVDVLDGERALVIFQGPAHYVSPSWYPTKAETGRVVPTWNYVVVHARGRVRTRNGRDWLRTLITDLTGRMERGRPAPWAVGDAPADFTETLLGQIVGIEIALSSLTGKFKLGQNRSAADRAGMAAGLAAEQPEVHAALRRLPGTPTDL
ncbi:MAG: FMN-binding negative transcriptional regulator [Pseudomonadales bacterium]